MANTKVGMTGPRYRYAFIDTAPGASGYWSDSVSMTKVNANQLFFSFSGGGVATVSIQYQLPHAGAVMVDYLTTETIASGARLRVSDMGAGVKWRAGVKQNNYSSGDVIVGFDW